VLLLRALREEFNIVREDFVKHILNAYSETVFRISFLHTRNRPDAEDITQDVFLSLLNPPAFNSEEHLKAWVIRATVNKCKNAARFKKRNKTVPLDAVSYRIRSEPFKEERLDVLDAFQKLPDQDRNILYLFYYEGYAAKEIAGLLEIKEAAVFKRLNRARKRLKGLLKYEL